MIKDGDPYNAFLPYESVDISYADDGPLSGLTLAVKDIYNVAGYPTGCGNPIKTSQSPIYENNAPIVQTLLDAGARIVGKTQTDELAFSLNGQNRHYPEPRNPRAPGRITGGSSSGSAAAVAGGLADFALGSDTGGSVRGPAGMCGLFGIRPSHERVSLEGVMPLASSFDVAGYFADDPDTFLRIAPVFLGEDERAFRFDRVFRINEAFERLKSDREAAVMADAQAIAAPVLGEPKPVDVAPDGLMPLFEAFRTLQAMEAWAVHGDWISEFDPEMTPGVRERFEFGATVDNETERSANAARAAITETLTNLVGDDGILVVPTMPTIPPPSNIAGDELIDFRERALSVLCLSGLSRLPQVSIPLVELDGMPMGLSLIGPKGSDRALIALAADIYRAR